MVDYDGDIPLVLHGHVTRTKSHCPVYLILLCKITRDFFLTLSTSISQQPPPMSVVQATLTDPNLPPEVRQKALNRANADPGIPQSTGTTKCFWLNEPSSIATKKSSSLPEDVDVVIIGSGICGTSVAKELLESNCQGDESRPAAHTSKPTVMMLEARDLCSGATGRNGGHILETGEDFVDLEAEFGTEAARSIMRLRLSHLAVIMAVVSSLGTAAQCQAREVEFVLACFGEEKWRDTVRRIRRLKEALPEETKSWKLIERSDAKVKSPFRCLKGKDLGG